jgi:hypothetical protein
MQLSVAVATAADAADGERFPIPEVFLIMRQTDVSCAFTQSAKEP